jgi:hypothetical protein
MSNSTLQKKKKKKVQIILQSIQQMSKFTNKINVIVLLRRERERAEDHLHH